MQHIELGSGFGERLMLLDAAAHEWIGLLAYDVSGKSAALFPAPLNE